MEQEKILVRGNCTVIVRGPVKRVGQKVGGTKVAFLYQGNTCLYTQIDKVREEIINAS